MMYTKFFSAGAAFLYELTAPLRQSDVRKHKKLVKSSQDIFIIT